MKLQLAVATSVALCSYLAPLSAAVDEGRPIEVIVVLEDAPVATYDGGNSRFAAPAMRTDKPGRPDMKSPSAVAYAAFLANEQTAFLDRISLALHREVTAKASMQHALNALILEVDAAELEALRKDPKVQMIEERRDVPVDTDAGPNFIGAPQLWFGQAGASTASLFSNGMESGFGMASRGEGVVIGIVDSGANQNSPSFADPSPDGYDHINPIAGGARLGWCNPGVGTVQAQCSDKIIGAWDFVDNEPPSGQCVANTYIETPGIEDDNGHGSHTASTSGGNPRGGVVVPGIPTLTTDISGVAPRANLVIFDVCYTCDVIQNGVQSTTGLCPNTSTTQAFNQAVADGVVDVMNFSIGGGSSPWTDSTSLAMLSAQNVGILVSASAGNSGPNANTLGHREPWTMTVAASTHSRVFFGAAANALSPNPPPSLQNVGGIFGESSPTTSVTGTLRYSQTFPQGCGAANPFPANFFQGAIALIERGGCTFAEKITNAVGAGATAVIVSNNNPTAPIIMGAAGSAVTSIMVTQAAGVAFRDFALANAVNSGQVAATTGLRVLDNNFGDVMASFSSRGPTSGGTTLFLDSIKPDVSGPGVSILAAYFGAPNSLAFLQGTSMSSPHAAGSAALVRGARPAWTPMEVKSALVMTGKTAMLKENGTTPSDPFDRGGGRIQPFNAAQAGLVMNETQANFSAANPAGAGDPSTLNLPSLANDLCNPNCSFNRSFRSTSDVATSWQVSIVGVVGTPSPATFTVAAGATQPVSFMIDGTNLTTTFSFGEAVLTPTDSSGPTLRMPIAVRR